MLNRTANSDPLIRQSLFCFTGRLHLHFHTIFCEEHCDDQDCDLMYLYTCNVSFIGDICSFADVDTKSNKIQISKYYLEIIGIGLHKTVSCWRMGMYSLQHVIYIVICR